MHGKIIKTEWRSGIDSVCIVAVQYKTYFKDYWQAYIGASRNITAIFTDFIPNDQKILQEPEQHTTTERRTAEHGCKLSWQEAHAFFPNLDITKYKTYPKEK